MVRNPAAASQALHGLQKISLRCPRSGRVQPCVQVAIAYGFRLQPCVSIDRTRIRFASQAARSTSKPSTAPLVHRAAYQASAVEKLNPPASTLPAPLETPERTPEQSTAGHWWKVGKAYWAFYKQGVKNIYANRKAAKEVRARLQQPSAAARSGPSYGLTRSDWHLERRSKSELRRAPIFALILAVFGEWTPLLVLFATPIVPYNCRIPRQIRKSREKQEARRSQSFRGEFNCLAGPSRGQPYIPSPQQSATAIAEGRGPTEQRVDTVLHVCRTLNVFPAWWDIFAVVPGLSSLWLTLIARPEKRLRDHVMHYIRRDDACLLRDGGGATVKDITSLLRDEEVLIAAEERGIDVLKRPIAQVRHDLTLWLENVVRETAHDGTDQHYLATAIKLSLMRPNQWEEWFTPKKVARS